MPPVISRRHALKTFSILGLGLGLMPAKAVFAQSHTPDTLTETRALMGTFVSITLSGASRDHMQEAMARAFEHMNDVIAIYNRFDTASPVSVLNAQGSLADCPPALASLLERSARYGALTGGAFNITVQPLVDLFRRYQNPTGTVSIPRQEWAEARALVRADGLRVEGGRAYFTQSGMGITLDGIAKGHIVDSVSAVLASLGMPNHLINAGGDILAQGEKAPALPWRVAVQNPAGTGTGMNFDLRNRALATSGSYEIFYDSARRYHHLIRPGSGSSPTDIVSASVLAPTAIEADALATSLSVMPPRDALQRIAVLPGRACLLLTADGRGLRSADWPNSLGA